MSDKRKDRYWLGAEKKDGPKIRLVRAPLTFGHSQLTFAPGEADNFENGAKSDESDESDESNESNDPGEAQTPPELFGPAGATIDKAIRAMHTCLEQALLLSKFRTLATLTDTNQKDNKLLKVLVLRASATEKVETKLKIHLVPYFRSHHEACQKRFEQRHQVLPGELGGMLGWLGEMEDRVDEWEVDYPREDRLESWANTTLELTDLADILRGKMEQG